MRSTVTKDQKDLTLLFSYNVSEFCFLAHVTCKFSVIAEFQVFNYFKKCWANDIVLI